MDKKPTDSEIKKALEHCKRPVGQHDCQNCPYVQSKGMCTTNLLNDTIDLINRLQAEKERLEQIVEEKTEWKDIFKQSSMDWKNEYIKLKERFETAKAEAYKEYIEEAKEQCAKIPQYHFNLLNVQWYLDDLLKKKGLYENK